jgi:hypothetical protein
MTREGLGGKSWTMDDITHPVAIGSNGNGGGEEKAFHDICEDQFKGVDRARDQGCAVGGIA